jgi:hypothetical protein
MVKELISRNRETLFAESIRLKIQVFLLTVDPPTLPCMTRVRGIRPRTRMFGRIVTSAFAVEHGLDEYRRPRGLIR